MVSDPSPIAAAHAGLDHNALVLKYKRMMFERLENLPLDGLSAQPHIRLRLNDVYIERTLSPAELFAAHPVAADANIARATLADLIRAPGSLIALVGAIGSGKSTCMSHIALTCLAAAGGEAALPNDSANSWAGAPPIPILLSAPKVEKALYQLAATPEDPHLSGESRMWHAIEAWFRDQDLAALLPIIQHQLKQGQCLLMIDGFDEVLNEAAWNDVVAALNQFTSQYPRNRYVVACGPTPAGALPDMRGFATYTLVPLEHSQIDMMVDHWYTALAAGAHVRLTQTVSMQIKMLQGLFHGSELLDELSASPLTLALWILVHAEGHLLPAAGGLILRRRSDLLLNGWAHDAPGSVHSLSQALGIGVSLSATERQALLESLALLFNSSPEIDGPPALSRAQIEPILAAPLQGLGIAPDQLAEQALPRLEAWLCRRGLLAAVAPGIYTMPHRLLCNYLALHALAAQPDFVDRVATRNASTRWGAALPLVAYELAHSGTPQVASELAERLLFEATPGRTMPPERHVSEAAPAIKPNWTELLLAASCIDAIGTNQSAPALRTAAQRDLIALLDAPKATLVERVEAGTLLGRLGDPRLTQLLPPMAQIPAGTFVLGKKGGYDDEGPEQRVHVAAFAIGIYPVTNQEYAAFVDDTSHQLPRYWHDARFNNMAHPVVGVTWHDAIDYCAWLDARLGQAGLRASDLVVRLPHEIEWEKAASWDPRRQTKREYPWGNEWSNTRANTADERGSWITTPVGCYPEGVSAYGLHDCIGNVWEWTASVYRSYPGAIVPFEEPGSYTLRGSSCVSRATYARCTFRSRLISTYWRYHLGFRIVIGRPLSA